MYYLNQRYAVLYFHRPQYWEFTHDAFCFPQKENSTKCTFSFAFCKGLPLPEPCANQSVCQMNLVPSIRAEPITLASLDLNLAPFDEPMDGKRYYI